MALSQSPTPSHSPSIQVRLFGAFQIRAGGRPCSIPRGKACSLLAYLLLQGAGPIRREQLVDRLWPDARPARARRNLSDALYRLRQALDPGWIIATSRHIGLSPELSLRVDLWEFEAAIRAGSVTDLARAVELYRGELLPELDDDWLLLPRTTLKESYLTALGELAQHWEKEGELARALIHYRQLAQADPLGERSYQGMMRILAGQQRISEALQLYDSLERLLAQEMQVAPSPESRRLAARLRDELELQALAQAQENALPQALPFVGRGRERMAGIQAVESTLDGQGGMLLVEGEAGMGKSRFLEILSESAAWRGATVLQGQVSPYPDPTPFTPLIQALAPALSSAYAAPVAELLADENLAALATLFPAWKPHTALAALPAPQARERLFHALVELILALADYAPQLLILDDMHRAEPSLWELLDSLSAHLQDRRLLLVLAYRRARLEASPHWSTLQAWEGRVPLRVIALKPLAVEDVARLLPAEMKAKAADIHGITGGNPFFIQELLLNHQEGEPLHQAAVTQRLQSLPPAARHALEAAAVLGERFSFRLWRDLLHLSNERLAQTGAFLSARAFLHPQGDGYRFLHQLVQKGVYQAIPPEQRQRLHARAAALLAQEPREEQLRLRAFHLDQAGARQEAAPIYAQAGHYEMARFAFPEAQAALERALVPASPQVQPERVETLLALAQVCEVMGEQERGKAALDQALALATRLEEEELLLRAMVQMGNWATRTGAHAQAHQQLTQALRLARRLGNREQEMEIQLILGDLALRQTPQQAKPHLEKALALARKLGRRPQEGRALEGLGWAEAMGGAPLDQVLARYQEALAVQRACQDLLGEAKTLLNILSACQNAGAWDKMLAIAPQVLTAQRRVHYRLGEGVASQALGLMEYALGNLAQAREHAATARAHFQAVGERLGTVIATGSLGRILQEEGELAQAETLFREAQAQAENLDSPLFEAFTLQDLAFLLVAQGRHHQALPILRQAVEKWTAVGDRPNALKCQAQLGLAHLALGQKDKAQALAQEGLQAFRTEGANGEEPQFWLWSLAQLCQGLGWEAEARELIAGAYQELQRQAQAIQDHQVRARFFHAVSLNRAIVAAQDRYTGAVRQQQVILARAGAPLGRRLGREEQVTVTWTLCGPEDEAIRDVRTRRRVALQRLLREAASQGGAPTDQELAQALGVSRRTVLRDMEALARAGVSLPTRGRR